MNILGISGGVMRGNQDGSAALLIDGELVFAQEEERLSREKHAVGALPERAVHAALAHAGLTMDDIDAIAFHAEYRNMETNFRRFFTHHFGACPPIRFVNHHLAHAASAYYGAGFDDAMILTADLSGDGISTTLNHGRDGRIEVLEQYRKPQSLGVFYSLVTQILGFRRDSDEYKVMGMASYGKADQELDWLLRIEGGGYRLDERFVYGIAQDTLNPSKQEPFYTDDLVDRLGWRRIPGEPYEERHFNFAASAQAALNRAAEALVRRMHATTGSRDLCIAGGVGLNCVMNQHLMGLDCVDRIFVQPAASDAGTALGAAYQVAAEEGERIALFRTAHLGNAFTDDQIRAELDVLGVRYSETDDPAGRAAEAIAEGKIIGWFQGRHEYGPRALGARSILGDPGRAEMKDLINHRVKFREEFRPFAPSILAEHAAEYFEDFGQELPYMTVTSAARPERAGRIPAVVHTDGTSRIQTVDRGRCPLYHDLISAFAKRTGTPVVLNTSYNVKGQPVVNTPTHAIGTLFGSGLDLSILGGFVVEKR